MKPVLIDTNVYCDALRGIESAANFMKSTPAVAVSPIVVGELLAGFRLGSREAQNRQQLFMFLGESRVSVLPIGLETADSFSFIFAELRRAGTPVPTNDIWLYPSQFGISSF